MLSTFTASDLHGNVSSQHKTIKPVSALNRSIEEVAYRTRLFFTGFERRSHSEQPSQRFATFSDVTFSAGHEDGVTCCK
jgi:hypothetical protein